MVLMDTRDDSVPNISRYIYIYIDNCRFCCKKKWLKPVGILCLDRVRTYLFQETSFSTKVRWGNFNTSCFCLVKALLPTSVGESQQRVTSLSLLIISFLSLSFFLSFFLSVPCDFKRKLTETFGFVYIYIYIFSLGF